MIEFVLVGRRQGLARHGERLVGERFGGVAIVHALEADDHHVAAVRARSERQADVRRADKAARNRRSPAGLPSPTSRAVPRAPPWARPMVPRMTRGGEDGMGGAAAGEADQGASPVLTITRLREPARRPASRAPSSPCGEALHGLLARLGLVRVVAGRALHQAA